MKGIKKYLRNSCFLFLEKIFRIVGMLSILFIITNKLSVDNFGMLSLVFSITFILLSISNFGLHSYTIKKLKENHLIKRYIIINTTILFKILLSFVLFFCVGILYYFNKENQFYFLFFLSSTALLFQPFSSIETWYESKASVKIYIYSKLVFFFLFFSFFIILITKNVPIYYYALLYSLDLFFKTLALIIAFFIEEKENYRFKVEISMFKKIFKNGFILLLSSIGGILNLKIDQYFISSILNNYELGKYSFSLMFIEGTYFIPLILSNALFPFIIDKYENKEIKQGISSIFFLLSILIIFLINIFSFLIIEQFYHEKYSDTHYIIFFLSLGIVFISQKMLLIKFLIIEKKYKILFKLEFIGAIVNILLNILLIPVLGLYGAIVASLLSYSVTSYFSLFFVKSIRDLFYIFTDSYTLTNIKSLYEKIFIILLSKNSNNQKIK